MESPISITKLTVQNGLPKSHRVISGIVWDEDDIVKNKELFLYHDWPTVHFASPWYEIEAEPETNEAATQRDIAILQKLLVGNGFKPFPTATIIDVHCGSGRHAIDLAKIGFRVVGMEEVEMPLQIARKSAILEHIPADFVLSTTKNHHAYANSADIVISMFNSLGYTFSQQDDQEQFHWIINLLQPGGYFVLDIRNHAYQKKAYAQPVTHTDILSVDNHTTATMHTTKFWQNNILGAREKIILHDRVVQYMTYGWNTYANDTLESMLNTAGAQLVTIQEDFYGDSKNQGERIFVVARKQ